MGELDLHWHLHRIRELGQAICRDCSFAERWNNQVGAVNLLTGKRSDRPRRALGCGGWFLEHLDSQGTRPQARFSRRIIPA
jgi:hypothetical protein